MKSSILKFSTLIVLMTYINKSDAQLTGVAINDNNATADASAMLDINVNTTSNTKKGILIPRVTTSQRDAIVSPATSLLLYNTTTARFEYYTGSSWQPLVSSSSSSGWGLTGNSGTSEATNFIGTTDYPGLVFKVNGTRAGFIGSLSSNPTSATALGFQSSVGGNETVAIGYNAAANTYQSIAIGSSANTATNTNAIAIGTGTVANGFQSVAIGQSAQATTSNGTIAIGPGANANAYETVAVGLNAAASNQWAAAFGARSTASGYNSTALGYNASVSNANYISIGNSSIQAIRGQVNFTTFSDGRFKRNIHTDVPGLKFITRLRPVTYNWDIHSLNKYTTAGKDYTVQNAAYNEAAEKAITEKEKIKYTGFIAQEVEQAANETGYNFSGVIKPKNGNDIYSLSYAEFVVPLVKATQELNLKNEKLSKKVEDQQKLIVDLSRRLKKLENKKY